MNTQIIPVHLIDLHQIKTVSVSGRGDHERTIADSLFPRATRASSALYDYELRDGAATYRIEVKKQTNDQWFDSGKDYSLSESNREIVMLFVNHIAGTIYMVAAIRLGTLLDLLLSYPEYKRYGWTPAVLKIAYDLKAECPELQFKAKLKVHNFIQQHREHFQIVYERSLTPVEQNNLVDSDQT